MVPSYDGGKFPLSTYLADRVRRLLADPRHWARLPDQVSDWLRIQSEVSVVPAPTRSWSRPSRAGSGIISCAIPSRGGSRIRASACC